MTLCIIKRDGVEVTIIETDPMLWFHQNTGSSMIHALAYEGYSIEEYEVTK